MNEMLTGAFEFAVRLVIILLSARICSSLVSKIYLPPVFGQILAGVLIGPAVFGGMIAPDAPVSGGLFGLALIGAVMFIFDLGLRTNPVLFFRYSLAGAVIGAGGAVVSFFCGCFAGTVLLKAGFGSPQCLFLGAAAMAAQTSLTAGVFARRGKMDSPEGVAVMGADVFSNFLAIIFTAVIFVIAVFNGSGSAVSTGVSFTAVKWALAIFVLSSAAGLVLRKSGIPSGAQKRIDRLYVIFVPLMFTVFGMMVNVREIPASGLAVFMVVYALAVTLAKVIGSGGLAILLGFNPQGAFRIGAGMIAHGEMTFIIAGAGLALGFIGQGLYSVIVIIALVTVPAAAALLGASLKIPGKGTYAQSRGDDIFSVTWDFPREEIRDYVTDGFLSALVREKFFIQMIKNGNSFFQARKNDIALSLVKEKKSILVTGTDLPYIKNSISKIITDLHGLTGRLVTSLDPYPAGAEPEDDGVLLSAISPDCVNIALKSSTKEDIIREMINLFPGRHVNREMALRDVLEREKVMSTGMQHGIALPHAKTEGVNRLTVAVGIKREGIDFNSIDHEKSRIFILMLSPKNTSGPHIRFLSAINAVLKDEKLREAVINSKTPEEAAGILRGR